MPNDHPLVGSCGTSRHDVVVIGGGLAGCSTALHLARAGARCVLLEREAECGTQASGLNAGGVRSLGRHPSEVSLARAAVQYWRDMPRWLGREAGFVASGQTVIAEDALDMQRLEHRARQLALQGQGYEQLLDQQALRQLLPECAPHCVGALHVADDGMADPVQAALALKAAASQAGAVIHSGEEVRSIERQGTAWRVRGRQVVVDAERVLNAAGAWASDVAAALDEALPIRVEAPMMLRTQTLPKFLAGTVLRVKGRFTMKQRGDGSILLGGGYRARVLPDQCSAELDLPSLALGERTMHALFPCTSSARVAARWAGLEGYVADGLPLIDESRVAPGVWHMAGFSGHGFALAPWCGHLMAEWMQSGRRPAAFEPFRMDRVAAQTSSSIWYC